MRSKLEIAESQLSAAAGLKSMVISSTKMIVLTHLGGSWFAFFRNKSRLNLYERTTFSYITYVLHICIMKMIVCEIRILPFLTGLEEVHINMQPYMRKINCERQLSDFCPSPHLGSLHIYSA